MPLVFFHATVVTFRIQLVKITTKTLDKELFYSPSRMLSSPLSVTSRHLQYVLCFFVPFTAGRLMITSGYGFL